MLWMTRFINVNSGVQILFVMNMKLQVVKLGIIPPINEVVTDSAFKISISVTATNGDRQIDETVILDVEVLESTYGNITLDDEILQPLQGVEKGSSQSTNLVIRNDGNVVFRKGF